MDDNLKVTQTKSTHSSIIWSTTLKLIFKIIFYSRNSLVFTQCLSFLEMKSWSDSSRITLWQLIITHTPSLLFQIVDIGLGSLDENAARVFLDLEKVTDKSKTINTFYNVNASVQVLLTLSEKQQLRPNKTSAEVSVYLRLLNVINGFQSIWRQKKCNNLML